MTEQTDATEVEARAWARGYMTADPDADPIEVARLNPFQPTGPPRIVPPASEDAEARGAERALLDAAHALLNEWSAEFVQPTRSPAAIVARWLRARAAVVAARGAEDGGEDE